MLTEIGPDGLERDVKTGRVLGPLPGDSGVGEQSVESPRRLFGWWFASISGLLTATGLIGFATQAHALELSFIVQRYMDAYRAARDKLFGWLPEFLTIPPEDRDALLLLGILLTVLARSLISVKRANGWDVVWASLKALLLMVVFALILGALVSVVFGIGSQPQPIITQTSLSEVNIAKVQLSLFVVIVFVFVMAPILFSIILFLICAALFAMAALPWFSPLIYNSETGLAVWKSVLGFFWEAFWATLPRNRALRRRVDRLRGIAGSITNVVLQRSGSTSLVPTPATSLKPSWQVWMLRLIEQVLPGLGTVSRAFSLNLIYCACATFLILGINTLSL